ncbi:MAG: hypothetical protein ACKVWV_06955 [Planctomycetota bacterium]
MRARLVLAGMATLTACATTPQQGGGSRGTSRYDSLEFHPPLGAGPRWTPAEVAMQGLFGVAYLDRVTLHQPGADVEIDSDDLDNYPLLGGGGQWKLAGEHVDFGLEALFSVAWRAGATAFRAGGGGAVIAIDVDTTLVDVFGGPFVNVFLGDGLRVYASAGPVLQFIDYEQEDPTTELEQSANGFGAGGYVRAGFEFRLPNGYFLGLGARRTATDADLDSDLGEFDVDATQFYVTVTTWM